MQNEIQTLKNIFDSNNIPVSLEWLRECINWCKSEALNPNYTLDQLKNSIHDQWLNLDLRDIETRVLPPDLSDKQFMVLNGNFSLQVMKIMDISKPKHWQMQQIRKQNYLSSLNEEKETTGSAKRMLQLTLTDGVQYVEAMEYKSIQILNINLTPGLKIRLSGPITIRRGRLMLEEHNVRILGGEVEELLITNAAENVLASALNLPLNNNPNIIDIKLNIEPESQNTTNRNTLKQDKKKSQQSVPKVTNMGVTEHNQNNYSMASTIRQDDFPTDEEMEMLLMAEEQYEKKSTNKIIPHMKKYEEPNDDEMELLMEIENKHNRENRGTLNKTPDLFEDDFDPDQIDQLLEVSKDKANITTVEYKSVLSKPASSINKRGSCDDSIASSSKKMKMPKESNANPGFLEDFVDEDLFADLDLEVLEKKVDGKSSIITVLELQAKVKSGCIGSFRIKARFKSIESKVTVVGEEYKAEIRIADESGDLVCRVHSDVISKWAGLTPAEMLDLRKNILSGKVEFKNKVQMILKVIMNKILELDNVMEIQLNGSNYLPIMKEVSY